MDTNLMNLSSFSKSTKPKKLRTHKSCAMEHPNDPMMQEIKLVKKNSQIDEEDKEAITPTEIKEPD